ncbi:MAG: MarP family serine protease [Solirubrobacteraceae bacterium]|nr:MarP family serine protease [Solirubrobacteraceae bacterium]
MSVLDWVLVVVALLAAAGGAAQGFLASGLGLLGFAVGALLGARLAPVALPGGSAHVDAPIAAIVGAVVLGIVLGTALQAMGDRLRDRIAAGPPGAARGIVVAVDRALGSVLATGLVVLAAWLLSGAILQARNLPADWRSAVRGSSVLAELRDALPPARDALALLSRIDALPGFAGPPAEIDAPDRAILDRPGVATGRRGVVRVEGEACGIGVVGSGWVVRDGLVVTNQHVIAGTSRVVVLPESGEGARDAHVVYADTAQDIAMLEVPGLRAGRLRMRDAERGTAGALLGYPLAGPFRARAARIASAAVVPGEDAYGRGPVRRAVLPFRGRVEQGNSGGPVVDERGRVLGTVFASAVAKGARTGYAVPNRVIRDALGSVVRGRAVSPGPCG